MTACRLAGAAVFVVSFLSFLSLVSCERPTLSCQPIDASVSVFLVLFSGDSCSVPQLGLELDPCGALVSPLGGFLTAYGGCPAAADTQNMTTGANMTVGSNANMTVGSNANMTQGNVVCVFAQTIDSSDCNDLIPADGNMGPSEPGTSDELVTGTCYPFLIGSVQAYCGRDSLPPEFAALFPVGGSPGLNSTVDCSIGSLPGINTCLFGTCSGSSCRCAPGFFGTLCEQILVTSATQAEYDRVRYAVGSIHVLLAVVNLLLAIQYFWYCDPSFPSIRREQIGLLLLMAMCALLASFFFWDPFFIGLAQEALVTQQEPARSIQIGNVMLLMLPVALFVIAVAITVSSWATARTRDRRSIKSGLSTCGWVIFVATVALSLSIAVGCAIGSSYWIWCQTIFFAVIGAIALAFFLYVIINASLALHALNRAEEMVSAGGNAKRYRIRAVMRSQIFVASTFLMIAVVLLILVNLSVTTLDFFLYGVMLGTQIVVWIGIILLAYLFMKKDWLPGRAFLSTGTQDTQASSTSSTVAHSVRLDDDNTGTSKASETVMEEGVVVL